jgi:hypothetical protein
VVSEQGTGRAARKADASDGIRLRIPLTRARLEGYRVEPGVEPGVVGVVGVVGAGAVGEAPIGCSAVLGERIPPSE